MPRLHQNQAKAVITVDISTIIECARCATKGSKYTGRKCMYVYTFSSLKQSSLFIFRSCLICGNSLEDNELLINTYNFFLSKDEFKNTHYGYANLNSAKQESGNAYTGVAGSYQYVDANGVLQTVNYVADALGFRVADSRLPVHNPELPVAPVHDAELPVAPVHEYDLPVAPVYDGA